MLSKFHGKHQSWATSNRWRFFLSAIPFWARVSTLMVWLIISFSQVGLHFTIYVLLPPLSILRIWTLASNLFATILWNILKHDKPSLYGRWNKPMSLERRINKSHKPTVTRDWNNMRGAFAPEWTIKRNNIFIKITWVEKPSMFGKLKGITSKIMLLECLNKGKNLCIKPNEGCPNRLCHWGTVLTQGYRLLEVLDQFPAL